MKLRFSKMQGLGNDFVVLDGVRQRIQLTPEQLRFLANRNFGVGCDQILLVERPSRPDVDFRYRIFNADGGEVEQCGNGARCFARFVLDEGLTEKSRIRVQTKKGLLELIVKDDGMVTVDMGEPKFAPIEIPFVPTSPSDAEANDSHTDTVIYPVQVGAETLDITVVSMGNPHAVQVVEDVDTAPVALRGPLLESHVQFPERVNVGFLQVVNQQHIRLRVYERGSGETLACGTGACAAVVAGIRRGLLASPVRVSTRGGELEIAWQPGQSVFMSGPAVVVFKGMIEL